ncbi:hypothetical protein Tco_0262467 [Tanacetum coccineum]
MEDEEVPTNMALMAFSNLEFNKYEFDLATYKRSLASVEEQLVFYKKNKPEFEGYGVKVSKSVCENSSNEIKKTSNTPIMKDWVSDCDEDEFEVKIMMEDSLHLLAVLKEMCDRKNSVLFTKTECLILSSECKLPDENQVMLKIPRKDNMYSFDVNNVVPSKCLTCLFAKVTNDVSNVS